MDAALKKARGMVKPRGHEIDTIYVGNEDRFIVSLIAGYGKEGLVKTPERAAAAALDLTRDSGSSGTHWYVYDRKTKRMHCFEQGEFDKEVVA